MLTLLLAVLINGAHADARVEKVETCFKDGPFLKKTYEGGGEKIAYVDEVRAHEMCTKEALEAAKKFPKDYEGNQKIAEVVGKSFSWAASLQIFDYMVSQGAKSRVCGDANFHSGLNQALNLTDEKYVSLAKKLGFKDCWPQTKVSLTAELDKNGPGSYFFDHTCGEFDKQNLLKGLQKKSCKK